MARVTDAKIIFQSTGKVLRADCFGNNIAVECPNCSSHPVLLIARPSQRGSSKDNPGLCRNCKKSFYIIEKLNTQHINELHLEQI